MASQTIVSVAPLLSFNLSTQKDYYRNGYAWAQQSQFNNKDGHPIRLTFYEGGYSPDTSQGNTQQIALRCTSAKGADAGILIGGGTLANGLTINGNYNDVVGGGTMPWIGEFPSCFQLASTILGNAGPFNNGGVWSLLFDIYVNPQPAQFTAITAFN